MHELFFKPFLNIGILIEEEKISVMYMDEQKAIQLLKQGDLNGLEWLVNQYDTEATKIACLITGNLQQAEDVVQESFLHAFEKIKTFDEKRSFRPWFLRSVLNRAVRKAEENSRWILFDGEGLEDDGKGLFISNDKAIEDQIEFSELMTQLKRAIYNLTPRQREVVIQRYFLNMSEKEMIKKLSLPRGTVKWLLHEARESLRSLLSERK